MEEQQPQKKSKTWIWILIILILIALGVGIWFFLSKGTLPIPGGNSIPQPPSLPN